MSAEPTTLVELYERALASPESPFIVGLDGLRSYTYGEAWVAAGEMATALAIHGARRGDRVALHVAKCSEAMIAYLACMRLGTVLVALNPGATDAELAYLLTDAEPSVVVVDEDRPVYHGAGRTVTTLETVAAERAANTDREAVVTAADLAAMVYTSGTTGRAKGAMITHGNLTSNALTLCSAWGFSADDVLLHALPVFHVHGLFVATNTVIAAGATMLFAPKFDMDLMLQQLPQSTVLMGVPTFYTRLLAEPRFTREHCRRLRLFISGSAPLLASVHREFESRTGQTILERYGMTETSMLTSNPLDGVRKPGSVGPALPGVDVRVVDATTGAPQPTGDIGQIEVSGPNVFPGYWRRPELAATEFRADGFFRTGDLGVFDEDGYLSIVGRSKDLIITGGFNVYPKEIEEAIDALPDVLESAVIGIADADFGEAVVAVVVSTAGAMIDPVALTQSLRITLASYKLPKRVHVVEALPRNALGKVEKARLRDQFG